MVICFNASNEAQKALDRLLSTGRYADLNALLSAAVTNLAVIDEAVSRGGGMTLPSPTAIKTAPVEPTVVTAPQPSQIPAIFTRPNEAVDARGFTMPNPAADISMVFDPSTWFWGQFNKLLPVKATCRGLFNVLAEDNTTNTLVASQKVTANAALLGKFLRDIDDARKHGREDSFSSAFPSHLPNNEKSLVRFSEQFVFSNGSFPLELGLIAFADETHKSVRLTEAGATFARQENPLLDGDAYNATQKFGEQELQFLRDHIAAQVPAERAAQKTILSAIKEGANNPDALDSFLRQRFPSVNTAKPSFLATQRSGVIARASDLGFLRRRREGIRVFYDLTDNARTFLSQIEKS
jgi:hypothetical protein